MVDWRFLSDDRSFFILWREDIVFIFDIIQYHFDQWFAIE